MAKQIKRIGKFSLPSNLSFRRSIDVSDGMLNSVMPDGSLLPVTVEQLTVRGALGMSTAGYDRSGKPLEGEALALAQYNPSKPNIQSIDRATLDPESDTLELSFSVAFHDGCMTPDACSKPEYRESLAAFMKVAKGEDLYDDLAVRYLWNLVNGRVLWRNGYGIADGVSLTISSSNDRGKAYSFDWGKLKDRRNFPGREALVAACVSNDKETVIAMLVSKIAAALQGADGLFAAEIAIRVRSYRGAEVWPSQEFVEGSQTKRNGREISRILASRTRKVAGQTVRHGVMHSQKIGNALRTIDEWHGDAAFGAIPVEAFGWVQAELAAARAPSAKQGIDAYRALENVAHITQGLVDGDEISRKDALYTLAIIIRGGVWGVSEKQDKAAA